MHKITKATVLENYRIELTFNDGTQGAVDLSGLAGQGVFDLWNNYAEFEKVRIGESSLSRNT